jgi:predicted RNase H-like nuclease (RuvC/YqgF family)
MIVDPSTLLGTSAGAITALGGLYTAFRHVRYGIQAKKDRERQAILDEANEQLVKIEARLELKIRNLQEEIESNKQNIDKDLSHMRQMYDGELKNLGNKIDELRRDLSDQHSSMVALLTRLVDAR